MSSPLPSSPLPLLKSYASRPSSLPVHTYLSTLSSLIPASTLPVLDSGTLVKYIDSEGREIWTVNGYGIVGDWCGCKSYEHGRGEGCKHIYAKYAAIGLSLVQKDPIALHKTVQISSKEYGEFIDRTLEKK
ncbi:hypothetical protein TrVE_jg8923 [Triparma verrucosa]|uniref:SWIM-type domain-containing protein n=1 Tax=Triparma verrucosa TaxID=1606542 RepID=A0A9W7BRG1_9STRA|nr:hypothetical protein TrVE_jg8923 [Triparma verrucosa]